MSVFHRCAAVVIVLAGFATFGAAPALAVPATLMKAELTLDEPGLAPGLYANVAYEFDLPAPLMEALHRGIPLYFRHDFLLKRERWYWFDKTVRRSHFLLRLSFDPLTLRYRLSYEGISRNFETLDDVLPYVKRLRRWSVADTKDLNACNPCTAELHFELDTGQLPKAMQVTAGGADDWTIESGWQDVALPDDAIQNP